MMGNIVAVTIGVLGQAAAGDAAASVKVQSVWDFVVKGGPVMIPIGVCSLIALTVIVERMVSLRRGRVIPAGLVGSLSGMLKSGAADRCARAVEVCRSNGAPLANIFAAGIKKLGEPAELLEKRIQETGQCEILELRKNLRALSVIAAVAPLLGLLGTIFGMINAFETVAASADALGRTELLAKGIYEALITTAAGLIVAIPVVISYHWFSARVDRLVAEMDRIVIQFVEEFARPRSAGVAELPARSSAVAPGNASDNGGDVSKTVALATA